MGRQVRLLQKMEEEKKINYLERLPPHLLILILDKVREARILKQTLAVSKMFAPLLRWVMDVSISCYWQATILYPAFLLPDNPPPLLGYNDNVDRHQPKHKMIKLVFTSKYFRTYYKAFLQDHSFSCLSGSDNRHYYKVDCLALGRHLKGFENIRSLRVNLTHSGKDTYWINKFRHPGMPKYCKLVELGGATQLIKSCIVLYADHGLDRTPQSSSALRSYGTLEEKILADIFETLEMLSTAVSIHSTLHHIVLNNPTVKDVVMTDDIRGSWFYAGEDAVTDLRTRARADWPNIYERLRDFCFKLWHVRRLPLPRSGRELRGVSIAILMSRDLASRQRQRSAVGGGPTTNYGEFLRSHFHCTHHEGPDGYGEFLRSYFKCDKARDGSQGMPFFIREAVSEISKVIDHLPCHAERDL
ncbi:hypothetical protein SAY86_024450 [Trapa natans]|uniref:F-box domain-containing protein n=1 Tax=Trapa natans TaxID=22666 RepID=A0AAN7RED2_TRANT|nr:hypothetical protein SAY86_024450 [Trapa natans]